MSKINRRTKKQTASSEKRHPGRKLPTGVYVGAAALLSQVAAHAVFRSTVARGEIKNQRLDAYLPEYDFFEGHKIVIAASPEAVFHAVKTFDLRKSNISHMLLSLRSIFDPKNPEEFEPTAIAQFTKDNAFMILLEEAEGKELVLGIGGKFWKPLPDLVRFADPAEFLRFHRPNYSKVAWNLFIRDNGDGTVTLSTETRTLCMGSRAKSLFRFYWSLISPYSAWIRLEMLKLIKRQAEGQT